jgi:hypothetical protein
MKEEVKKYIFVFRGQRLAEQMQQSNPDLVDQLRRQMGTGPDGEPPGPPPPNEPEN